MISKQLIKAKGPRLNGFFKMQITLLAASLRQPV